MPPPLLSSPGMPLYRHALPLPRFRFRLSRHVSVMLAPFVVLAAVASGVDSMGLAAERVRGARLSPLRCLLAAFLTRPVGAVEAPAAPMMAAVSVATAATPLIACCCTTIRVGLVVLVADGSVKESLCLPSPGAGLPVHVLELRLKFF